MRRVLFVLLFLAIAIPAFATWPFAPKYALTVINGSGAGSYKAGAVVPIAATIPHFSAWLSSGPAHWGSTPQDFADPNAAMTTFTMPKHDTTIQATAVVP